MVISAKYTAPSGDVYIRYDEKITHDEAADKCASMGEQYSLPYMREQTHFDVSGFTPYCMTHPHLAFTLSYPLMGEQYSLPYMSKQTHFDVSGFAPYCTTRPHPVLYWREGAF